MLHPTIVPKLRCCEQEPHFAQQVIGQARFRQEYVTSRLFRPVAVALPCARRQHDEWDRDSSVDANLLDDNVGRYSGFSRELGRRQRSETELGSQPPADHLDRLIHLGYTAGTENEDVLAFRQGVEADIDASLLRS